MIELAPHVQRNMQMKFDVAGFTECLLAAYRCRLERLTDVKFFLDPSPDRAVLSGSELFMIVQPYKRRHFELRLEGYVGRDGTCDEPTMATTIAHALAEPLIAIAEMEQPQGESCSASTVNSGSLWILHKPFEQPFLKEQGSFHLALEKNLAVFGIADWDHAHLSAVFAAWTCAAIARSKI